MAFAGSKKKPPRAKGEGSIFQRADGMWVGCVEAPPGDTGKRRQKRVYSKDYRTLVAKLNELKSDVADGYNLNRSMTVAQWLDYWLPNIHRERVRPNSYRDYGHTAHNIATAIGHHKLIELTPAEVRHMHHVLGRGRRRTQKAHTLLHRAMTDAVAEGLIRRNVVSVVDAPEVESGEATALSVDQAQSILTHASSHRTYMEATRWLTAFLTGARQGEVLGLTWDRIDLEAGTADITWQLQQLSRSHGCEPACGKRNVGYCPNPVWRVPVRFEHKPLHAGLALTRPKSAAGKRWVPIIEPLKVALTELRDRDSGANPHNLVFHRADGRPVVPSDDNAAWNGLLREAKVIGERDTLSLHTCRHTAATVLRAAGADEQTRMEILGHASAEVTRVYAHADQAKNSAMMDALGVLVPSL